LEIKTLQRTLQPIERGLVIAGRLTSREQGEAVKRLAKDLGWPLLPDIGSQARLGTGNSAAFYDALLANEEFAASHAPEAVLHVGGRALSKRLEKFVDLSRSDPYIVVRENPFRLDPSHRVTHSVETNVVDFCDALSQALPEQAPSDWLSGWREASEDVGQRFGELLLEDGDLSEPAVARVVSRHVPEGHGLVVAASMPVRDLDTFAVADGAFVPVAANRGASGIDGTVATAAGFACGLDGPVTLVIGDLALLHDLNSLAMLRSLPVTVVVINNDGGGIFSFLPVAGEREFFEPYFGTPQGVGFESAANMFGLSYENPKTAAEFVRAYRSAVSGQTSTLIEVNTNRDENVTLHGELLREVSGNG
jgi:2-succinyl-5-enolpyruvyl-6-hydroxy-3-cyclohexene-1-carboxylate synthase